MKTAEKFNPKKMQAIIERLKQERRLPSAEEFVRDAERIREETPGKLGRSQG